jgi:hypothetical protein
MEVAYAAIPPLGFGLDLMVHKVLMRMRGGAWCEVVVLVRGWPKLETGWWRAQAKWPQVYGEATAAEVRAAGVRRRVNGVNPDLSRSTYRGSTGSARCGSFRRIMRYNSSIPIISQEDCAGFIVNRPRHDLNFEFRSSAAHKAPSGHPDGKQDRQAPTSH